MTFHFLVKANGLTSQVAGEDAEVESSIDSPSESWDGLEGGEDEGVRGVTFESAESVNAASH